MKLENNGELLVAEYGGVEVRVGEADLAQILIERIRSATWIDRVTAAEIMAPVPIDLRKLPAIGAEWEGGLYAGITVHDNRPMALVLLPGDEKLNWKDAGAWAEKAGGTLPSKVDSLILFQNLKSEFKDECYWTSEVHPSNAACAFIQGFALGSQLSARKVSDYRARAVRRVAI